MKSRGIVFDIQRFSIHDGPGIRTTVFFKGCPLHCAWCHNPESWLKTPQVMVKENGETKLSGREMTVSEVMCEVMADVCYYKNSGGGMTVSGGEPMLQFAFLQELLKASKRLGIHNCIETSGFAEKEKFEEIVEYVDVFLFDVKHTNDDEHKKYTGVSNQLILSNLNLLYEKGVSILLRCPIIPGISDTEDHIAGIAELTQKYPDLLGVEILPYHDMGKGKWEQIGKDYVLSDLKTMDEEQKRILLRRFQDAGCQKVICAG